MTMRPSKLSHRAPSADAEHRVVMFSGIRFELTGARALLAGFGEVPFARVFEGGHGTPAAQVSSEGEGVTLAHARVRLSEALGAELAARAGTLGSRALSWEWSGTMGSAVTTRAHAWWRSESRGAGDRPRIDVEAKLAAGRWGAESLLTALAAALIHRAGGAVLHAASVGLSSRGVVAFVGPSGAGKSTACRQVSGAPLFSVDRLAVAPEPQSAGARWLGWALPGGTGISEMSEAGASGLPLAAVLRVHKAQASRLAEPSRTLAVSSLRASAFHAGHGTSAELELLTRLERLAAEVPFANLYNCLGTSLEAMLRRWLAERQLRSGVAPELTPRSHAIGA